MTSALAGLAARLDARAAAGLARSRRTLQTPQGAHVTIDGRAMLSFASNDYLGLAADPRLAAAVAAAAAAFGTGAGASHLLGGHQSPHAQLEHRLATWCAPCAEAEAVVLATGYLANLAALTALAGRDSVVFGDRRNHACLNDGALLARATYLRYPHLDMAALATRLAASKARCKVIATDSVFSMDGSEAPLAELLALAELHDAWLLVDDAHGFGVVGDGRGSVVAAGLGSTRIVYMATLGKAAGVAGAFICAHPAVIATIVQTARPYMYTTAAPAMLASAVQASMDIIRDEPERRNRLAANIAYLRAQAAALPWPLLSSRTAIQPLLLGATALANLVADALWARGLYVPAIRPPTVPQGSARLRVSLSAAHTRADIDTLVAALRAVAD